MKNKIFKLVSIIVPLTLLISFIGCKNKNNEKITNEKSYEKVNSENESVSKEKEINYEEEYYSYIKSELIPKYGLSNINSTQGTMKTMYDNWFNPSGILSAKIYDFDNDGIKELFLIRIEEAEEKSSVYNNQCSEYYFYGEIYKFINNTITLIDKTLIKSCDNFETDEYISFKFMSNQYCIDDLYINIVSIDNRNYILFEFNSYPGAFATGEAYYSCWALEYKQEKLNMVFGISGTGLDCGYVTGYNFDSGNLNSKVLLYSEMDETKSGDYKSFNEAIKGFLGKFNISTKDGTDYRTIEESILSDENKIEKILEYHIKSVNNNSNQFIFETEARDFTNLREHCNKELNENETKTTEIYNESNSEDKYYEYIETSLLKEINLPELNEFQVRDNSMKVDIDSKNFGLISALICDLDNDEKKELLCVVSEKSNECDTIIDLRIYKIVNNEVKLIDSLQEDKKIKIIGAQDTSIFLENNNIYVSSFGGSLSFTNRFSGFKVIKYEDNKLSLIKDYLIRRVVGYRTISELSSNKIYYEGDENDTISVEKGYEELKKDLKEVNLERCLVYHDDDEQYGFIEQYNFIDGTEDNTSDVLIFESRFSNSDYVSSYSRFFKDYTNLRDKINN